MSGTTTKYAIPYSAGTDTIASIDNTMQALAERIEVLLDQVVPVGAIFPTAKAAPAPTGWLMCDGTVVSRTTYAALFAIVGTVFNTGGEAGTDFRLPDLRGRVPVGEDGTAGRLDASDARGNVGGEQKHLNLGTESGIAMHNHTTTIEYTSVTVGSGGVAANMLHTPGVPPSTGTPSFLSGVAGNINAVDSHNNMQPYTVVNYMIRSGV